METDRLKEIYKKTDGNCHICHAKLSFSNYAAHGANGSWEVEHSKPKSKGGTDNLNNLFAAHIRCNREKGTLHTRTARSYYGNSRAPLSKNKKQNIKAENTTAGVIIGGLIGSLFGPGGTIIGAGIGAAIGNESSPKK